MPSHSRPVSWQGIGPYSWAAHVLFPIQLVSAAVWQALPLSQMRTRHAPLRAPLSWLRDAPTAGHEPRHFSSVIRTRDRDALRAGLRLHCWRAFCRPRDSPHWIKTAHINTNLLFLAQSCCYLAGKRVFSMDRFCHYFWNIPMRFKHVMVLINLKWSMWNQSDEAIIERR